MKTPRLLLALGLALALFATACSSSSSNSSGTTSGASSATTLNLAFSSDMEDPDPDTVYQLQGNQVVTALYEGLLDYAPDGSNEIVPLLAESYTVSDDKLTYTFKLRPNLKFSDGTPLDSTAMKAGFERRIAENVAAPAAYMLAGVSEYQTPDPSTFVMKLSAPDSAFITYLASMVSPKAINPKVLAENASDNAVEFMKTQSAGTGPYVIKEFTRGQQYVLERNENYWGPKPYYETVNVKIIPDAASQIVQLQGGDLDIVTGQPIATVKTFENNADFQIVTYPVLLKAWLHVNIANGPTSDPAFRAALRSAIDRPALVDQVWGTYGAESTQMYPVEMLPAGLASDTWKSDSAALKALSGGKTLTIGYLASLPADRQVVETLQTQLQAAGLSVELVPLQTAEVNSFSADPSTGPDLIYEVAYPDSSHPDTWARLFWYSDVASGAGGFLNYLVAGSPAADAAMNAGIAATDQATEDVAYGQSGDLIHEQVSYISLADPQDVFIARKGITGFAHWLPTPFTLQLKALKEG